MTLSLADQAAFVSAWRSKALAEKSLLCLGMLALAITLPPFPGAAIVLGVMVVTSLVWARIPWRILLKTSLGPLGFLATGAVALMFRLDSHGLSLALDGWRQACDLTLRATAGLSCLLAFSLTTPATEVVDGMNRIGVPREIVEMALLIYRFLFQLLSTAEAMAVAQDARLGRSTWRRWIRSLGLMIANLLPRALDHARRMETGLAARGWTGEMRVLRRRPRPSRKGLSLILLLEGSVLVLSLVIPHVIGGTL